MINMEVEIIKGKKKYNDERKILNVAAYVRVSTRIEGQKSSFNSQVEYFKQKIENNKNWNLVKIYSDYGISGRDILNRTEFLDMIIDALNGKIDLILTKSISRFARNMEQFLKYIRMLKNNNVGIYFEEENINTLDMNSEFLVSILSLYAEQEAINYSYNVQKGSNMRAMNGEQKLYRAMYGYKLNKNKTKFLIVNKEAEVVRLIYDLFLNQDYSVNAISRYLKNQGIPTASKTGNWCFRKVKEILSSQYYIGNMVKVLNNTGNYIDYKKLRRDKNNYFIIENTHAPIIDKDMFFKVQDKLETIKNNTFSNTRNEMGLFWNNKIRCGFCGSKFIHHVGRSADYFGCVRLTGENRGCADSKRIRIKFIECTFIEGIKKYRKTNNKTQEYQFVLQRELDNLLNKKNKIIDKLDLLANEYINKRINLDNYYSKKKEYESLLNELDTKIEIQNNTIIDNKKLLNRINNFNNDMANIDLDNFNKNIIDKLILLIIVGGYKKNKSKTTNIRFIYDNQKMFEITDKPLRERNKLDGINIDNEKLYCVFEYKIKRHTKLKNYDSRIRYDYCIRFEIPIVDMEDMIWK